MDTAYLDSFGLPGAISPTGLDMGDSCADYFTVMALSEELDSLSGLYFNGEYPVRHPDATKWWGQSNRFSRDQLIPMLCYGIIRHGNEPLLKKVFKAHLWRCLAFAWNTAGDSSQPSMWKIPDITFIEVFGLWLRYFKPFGYKVVLPLCDIETVVNALLWRYYQPESNQLTRNHMLVSIVNRKEPSLISRLIDKINNYQDLVSRWAKCIAVTKEYPTVPMFEKELGINVIQ